MKTIVRTTALAAFLLLPTALFGAEAAAGETKKTFIDMYKEGGSVMHICALFSVGVVWLTIDIWMRTNAKKMTPPSDVQSAQQFFLAGDYVGAYQAMKAGISPFTQVARAALSSVGYGKEATEEALIAEVDKINSTLQTRINYLSVIGVCAPMVGLLGTVGGMRGAFSELGTSGIGDPTALSAHIGEVLVATAAGLFVAIPAFMAFYFLRNKLQAAVHHLQEEAEALFRNAPYEYLKDADVGQEATYAALPNWVAGGGEAAAQG